MIERITHASLWPVERPVIGMIHLQPLPGSPRWAGSLDAVRDRALHDLAALLDGGVHGVLVENYGDAPFHPAAVAAETVASMAVIARAVVDHAEGVPVGVNVLRNDACAALGIAAAAGCAFIRVNVHTGALLTDQGWITGAAHETLRLRARLGARVAILADVLVKHATAPAGFDIAAAARDAWHRGLADALIVTGAATGHAVDTDRLRAVGEAVPEAPLWIGSGLEPANARILALADGAIVGSALQHGGAAGAGVDPARVRALMRAIAASVPAPDPV
jgi:membrane complex biogenesis BtpA family protein